MIHIIYDAFMKEDTRRGGIDSTLCYRLTVCEICYKMHPITLTSHFIVFCVSDWLTLQKFAQI